MLFHDGFINAASTQKSAVDFRVQSFDPAIHYFRKSGVLRNLCHFDAILRQQGSGTAG